MNEIQVFGGQPATMTSREIGELVESRHDSVKRAIETLVAKGVIVQPQSVDEQTSDAIGRPRVTSVYHLDKRSSLIVVAQLSPEFTARIVDRWQELEQGQPRLPRTMAEALRLAADQSEQIEALAIERDHAIATKAQIGDKKVATAMATASNAVRKAGALEIQLDRSKEYATIKRMEMKYHGTAFNWRLLKSAASEMGMPAIDVFDANYGTVKAYHESVWREAYAVGIEA